MGSIVPPAIRVLLVDDEPALRQVLEILVRRLGFEAVAVPGFNAARDALAAAPQPFQLVITDLAMPDGSGIDVLAAAKQRDPATEVILMTAHSSLENAVGAMRAGAFNFVAKPFDPAQLGALIVKALEKHDLVTENARLKAQVDGRTRGGAVARSDGMRRVFDLISRVADTRANVLITGESGTGKERVARALHEASARRDAPFLVVNCGALPENLMESELFGHERGAFTGAVTRTLGIFRDAERGTVLLDEVGELPAPLQVKLLRVLQERKVRPVGATQEVPVDVRVLAATNRDVEVDVRNGLFRQDLYYRLNVIRVELPPLRQRKEDIPALIERFVADFAKEMGKDVQGLTPDALRAIERYPFPGNVRELENIIERAVALAGARSIGLGDLPQVVSGISAAETQALLNLPEEGCRLDEVLSEAERRLLLQALERTGGVRTSAASLLGISFRSLRYRLAKHGFAELDEAEAVSEVALHV